MKRIVKQGTRIALAAATSALSALLIAPSAYAVDGDEDLPTPALHSDVSNSETSNSEALTPDAWTCVVEHLSPFERVDFGRVCKSWHKATQLTPFPVATVHNRVELQQALENHPELKVIVITPTEFMEIGESYKTSPLPMNHQAAFVIYRPGSPKKRLWINVCADINVTVTGGVWVWGYGNATMDVSGNSHIYLLQSSSARTSGNVSVIAAGNCSVIATGNTWVEAKGAGATITASENSRVLVFEAKEVQGKGSGIRIFADSDHADKVKVEDPTTLKGMQWGEMRLLDRAQLDAPDWQQTD